MTTSLAVTLAVASGVAMVAVHPALPVIGVIGAVIAAFLLSSPYIMLVTFIGVLFLRPAEFFPQLQVLSLGKLTALGALGLFMVSKFLRRDTTWAKSTHNALMACLTVALLGSSFLGTWPGDSIAHFTDVFVKILIIYVLVVNLVDTPKRALGLQVSLAIFTAILGGYALYMKETGGATVEGSRAGAVGLLGDPNDLALTLLMTTPFLVAAVAETKRSARWFFVLLLFCTMGGVIATQSRGGLLGLAIGLYFALRHRIKSRAVVAVIGGAAMLGLFTMAGVEDRKGLEGEQLDESAEGRLAAWRAGGRMLRARPLLGVGYGQFPHNFATYADSFPTGKKIMATHNSYIQAYAETGLLGGTAFMGLVVVSLLVAWRLWRRARDQPRGLQRALLGGQLGNLAAVLASAFFLSQAWTWFPYVVFAQLAAMRRIYDVKDIVPWRPES